MKKGSKQTRATRKKISEGTKRAMAEGRWMPFDSESQRARRKVGLKQEADASKKLEEEGYEVFVPSWVCDRIAIKDGKLFLVEFKKPDQELRPNQRRVQEVCDRYLIVRLEGP